MIVDPSEDLQALFQKAITFLFPKTNVLMTANAEGALKLVEAAKLMEINTTSHDQEEDRHCKVSCNGCDIIIVDENLRRKMKREIQLDADDTSSQQLAVNDTQEVQHNSCSSNVNNLAMSGSELMNLMTKAENTSLYSTSNKKDECGRDLKMSNKKFRPSFYIGVSVFLSDNGPKFLKSGADLIWGKPPPKIDGFLRNQLVTTLLKKGVNLL